MQCSSILLTLPSPADMDRTLEWPYSHASFIASPNPCALLVAPSRRLAHHQPPLTHFGASAHPLALGT